MHPSSLVWFRYGAKDLHPWEVVSFRWHTARCAECAERLAVEREGVSAPVPPLPFPSAPAARGDGPLAWIFPALTSAALVLLAVWVSPAVLEATGLQAKGGSQFDLWIAAEPPRLLGKQCEPGQRVQPLVETHREYLLVIGIDPSGTASVLFPVRGQRSGTATQGKSALPQSWTFDAAPGTERFIALFSDAPIDREQGLRFAEGVALPRGVERVERSCVKVPAAGETP